MRNFPKFLALLGALAVAGCGDESPTIEAELAGDNCPAGGLKITDGDEVHFACESATEAEPAGENCASGGVRIITAGGVYYVCEQEPSNGDGTGDAESGAKVERLPASSDEHDCFGDAMKITLPGPPVSELIVCVEGEPVPRGLAPTLNDLSLMDRSEIPERRLACAEDDEARAIIERELFALEATAKESRRCVTNAIQLIGPPPQGGELEREIACWGWERDLKYECHLEALTALEGAERCDDDAFHDLVRACEDRDREEPELDCDGSFGLTVEEVNWKDIFFNITDQHDCYPRM